jgi:opacity protein-like surface antigen
MTHRINRRGSLFVFAFVVALCLDSHTLAQTREKPGESRAGTTELTIFGGISVTAKSENSPFNLQVKTDVPFGGRIAYNLDSHNAVEFTVAKPISFHANYVYNFPSRAKLDPYLTAGIGGSRYGLELGNSLGAPNVNSNEKGPDRKKAAFTTNFGGGVKYFIIDRIALRFDLRAVVGIYKATFANVIGVPGGIVNGKRTLNDVQFTAGIVFKFR